MTWFYATSVSVTNGATVVSVNAGDDLALAQGAGGLVIGTQPPVEIKRTYLDGGSNKKIELLKPWPYGSQTNQAAVAFPTDGDLAAATAVLKQLIDGFTLATQAEAQAGTENTKPMTALRVKQALDALLGTASKLDATTSETDRTTGRALRVGDHGNGTTFRGRVDVLGGQTPAQIIALHGEGFVYNGTIQNHGGSTPESWGIISGYITSGNAYSYTYQEFTGIYGGKYRRTAQAGGNGWNPWTFVYDGVNIVGPVSFSSGVNTGSIIEYGTNSNGEYLKMADGSAFAWGRVIQTGLSISPTKAGNTNTAYPCNPTLPLSLLSGVAVSIGQRAFYDASNDLIYSVLGAGANGYPLMFNLGTKPSGVWPALDVIGTSVAVKADYFWTAKGRWR